MKKLIVLILISLPVLNHAMENIYQSMIGSGDNKFLTAQLRQIHSDTIPQAIPARSNSEELAQLKLMIQDLQNQLAQKDAQLNKAEQQINTLKEMTRNLATKIRTITEEKEEAESAFHDYHEEIQSLTKKGRQALNQLRNTNNS